MNKLKYDLVKTIDSFAFDRLVQEVYGIPYCFQQQDGCKSRGTHHFSVDDSCKDWGDEYEGIDEIPEVVNGPEEGVSFTAWLARDPKKPLEDDPDRINMDFGLDLFYSRNFHPSFDTLVKELYLKGHIDAGEYTLNIDW